MGKRWMGGNGGRRPVLDIGRALNVTDAVPQEEPPPPLPPPHVETTSAVAAGGSNVLLGLLQYGDEDEADNSLESGVDGSSVSVLQTTTAEHQPSAGDGAWQCILDPGSSAYYYWNTRTNEVRWTCDSFEEKATGGSAIGVANDEQPAAATTSVPFEAPTCGATAPVADALSAAPAKNSGTTGTTSISVPASSLKIAQWRQKRTAHRLAQAQDVAVDAAAILASASTEADVAVAAEKLAAAEEAAQAAKESMQMANAEVDAEMRAAATIESIEGSAGVTAHTDVLGGEKSGAADLASPVDSDHTAAAGSGVAEAELSVGAATLEARLEALVRLAQVGKLTRKGAAIPSDAAQEAADTGTSEAPACVPEATELAASKPTVELTRAEVERSTLQLLHQVQTRHADWREGALNQAHFWRKLEVLPPLAPFDACLVLHSAAVPEGCSIPYYLPHQRPPESHMNSCRLCQCRSMPSSPPPCAGCRGRRGRARGCWSSRRLD